MLVVLRIGRAGVLLALMSGVLACTPLSRNEPTLLEKCEELAEFCGGLPEARADLRECHEIGRRGVRDEDARDRCFVAYDRCVDDCFLLYRDRMRSAPSDDAGSTPPDAGD